MSVLDPTTYVCLECHEPIPSEAIVASVDRHTPIPTTCAQVEALLEAR